MKLWIDDMRDAPDESWTVVRKVQPAIVFLATFGSQVTHVSIDHDIENRPDDETFRPVAYFLGMMNLCETLQPLTITVHSDNPVGARDIVDILHNYGLYAEWHPYTTQADFAKKFGLDQ